MGPLPQGGSDPIFSLNDTINWWRTVDAANHGDASSFVRVYPVPGMNHCNHDAVARPHPTPVFVPEDCALPLRCPESGGKFFL
jgi:Tannase and feruloyl esterase